MTRTYSKDFGPFDGQIWLDCAGLGALPRVAVAEAVKALDWRQTPHHLPEGIFLEVPRRLKEALGKLTGAKPEEIILGNSTSYGLHVIANGFPWKAGDEVLLVRGDFPASRFPWYALEKLGVKIGWIEPRRQPDGVPDAEEVREHITVNTRVFCTSWVNSFTGYAIDIQSVGDACRANGVYFVLNGSQAVGARPLDVSAAPVDAVVSAGFKWLCGPYGTGFCWMTPELLDKLEYNQEYWFSSVEGEDLNDMRGLEPKENRGARKYDVFCTANFLNFMPWAATVEYLLEQGIEQIADYDQMLVSHLLDNLDMTKYRLISSKAVENRSTLVILTTGDVNRNKNILESLINEGIFISLRENYLRISPHLYNTVEEIAKLVSRLNAL